VPVVVARGLRTRRHRLDRGAVQPAPALAAALPVVVRDHAGDVEAPPCAGRQRQFRQVRPFLPQLPDPLSRAAAADRAGGRRVLALRGDVPQPGQGSRFLADVPPAADPRRRVRAPARLRTAAVPVGAAVPAGRLPSADVPGHHPLGDHRAARHPAAVADDHPDRRVRRQVTGHIVFGGS
jgi:hypothetical protein